MGTLLMTGLLHGGGLGEPVQGVRAARDPASSDREDIVQGGLGKLPVAFNAQPIRTKPNLSKESSKPTAGSKKSWKSDGLIQSEL